MDLLELRNNGSNLFAGQLDNLDQLVRKVFQDNPDQLVRKVFQDNPDQLDNPDLAVLRVLLEVLDHKVLPALRGAVKEISALKAIVAIVVNKDCKVIVVTMELLDHKAQLV